MNEYIGTIDVRKAYKLVEALNKKIMDSTLDDTELLFEVVTTGKTIYINWMGLEMWSSSDDKRKYVALTPNADKVREDLYQFIVREIEYIKQNVALINLNNKDNDGGKTKGTDNY